MMGANLLCRLLCLLFLLVCILSVQAVSDFLVRGVDQVGEVQQLWGSEGRVLLVIGRRAARCLVHAHGDGPCARLGQRVWGIIASRDPELKLVCK
eukprot:1154114-Pelagomonas_calceolata.AAC.6